MSRLAGCAVAVTGGAGLIGSYLVDHLVVAGAHVVVVDDFSKGLQDNIAQVAGHVEVRQGDLQQAGFAAEACAGADVVFHLASRAYGVGYSEGRHLAILHHNEAITNNLLAALADSPPRWLLVTSSSCVYDDNGPETIAELPVFEGEPEMANWGYGWAKRFLEQKSRIFARETGVPVTVVRPFNIYGERYNWVGEYSQAIPMLVKRVMEDDPVVIWGSGRQRRSYVHADDCARMMLALVESEHHGEPVNIGTEQTVAMVDLVASICDAADLYPALRTDPTKPEGRFIKSADMSRFHSLVPDFRLGVSLDQGMERMIGWYRHTFRRRESV